MLSQCSRSHGRQGKRQTVKVPKCMECHSRRAKQISRQALSEAFHEEKVAMQVAYGRAHLHDEVAG